MLIQANPDVFESAPKKLRVDTNCEYEDSDYSDSGFQQNVEASQSAQHLRNEHNGSIAFDDASKNDALLAGQEFCADPEPESVTSVDKGQSPDGQIDALQVSDWDLEITEISTEEDCLGIIEPCSESSETETVDQETKSALNDDSALSKTDIHQLTNSLETAGGIAIGDSAENSHAHAEISRPGTNCADYFEIDNPFADDLTESTTDAGIHTGEGIYMSEEMLDEAVEADLLDTTEPIHMESIVLDDEVLAADLLDSDSGSTSSTSNGNLDSTIPAFPEYRRFAERNPSNHLVWNEEKHAIDPQPDFGSNEIANTTVPPIPEDLKFNNSVIQFENSQDAEIADQDACKGRSIARNYMVIELPVKDLDQGDQKTGRLSDITEKGLQITGLEVEPGEMKRLMIDADGLSDSHSFELEAECRWSRREQDGSYYAGFQITAVSEEGLINLRKIIDLLAISQEGFC